MSWRWFETLIYPIALLASAIGIVYWYWTTTPSYALTCIVDSIRHHDAQTFEKYVDIDAVASHAFDQLIDGPAAGELLNRQDSFIGPGFIRFFKRDIVGIAHERLCNLVADPNVELESATSGTMESLQRYRISPRVHQSLVAYGLTKDGFRGIKYLKINGSTALLGLDFFSPYLNRDYVVEFRMEDTGGYWRVTELTNLNELVERYLNTRSRLQV